MIETDLKLAGLHGASPAPNHSTFRARPRSAALLTMLVGALVAALPGAAQQAPSVSALRSAPDQVARAKDALTSAPLGFELNRGQTDSRAKFLARLAGSELMLTGDGAVFVHRGVQGTGMADSASATQQELQMRLIGAREQMEPAGLEPLVGTVSYFVGSDPAGWRSGAPMFARIRYEAVYPGVDLVFYGNRRQLEYDFVAQPGSDPRAIRLRFDGAEQLRLEDDGDLTVTVADGSLGFHKPQVYQTVNGKRQPVEGSFALIGRDTVGFRVGRYDHTQPLVIDPVLSYSTFLGGSWADAGEAVALDAKGNIYVAGQTSSANFPVTPAALQGENRGWPTRSTNVFISKFDPTGTTLIYSTYLGGSGSQGIGDVLMGLQVDAEGDAYIAGFTSSKDFPVTHGAFQTTNRAMPGSTNAFIAKINPSGTKLEYSTYLGGSTEDWASGLAIDSAGNAYVSGGSNSVDFPSTKGAFRSSSDRESDAFAAKLNPAGSHLVYATFLGPIGEGLLPGNSAVIALDGAGRAYVAGSTTSTRYPVTPGAIQKTNRAAANGMNTVFVSKLNATGAEMEYSTFLGGTGGNGCCLGDVASAIAVDSKGSVYVAGATQSTDFPVTSKAFQRKNNAAVEKASNAFVAKLSATLETIEYSTYLGGEGGVDFYTGEEAFTRGDVANGLAVDSEGNAYIVGAAISNDFPVTSNAYQQRNGAVYIAGGYNGFLTELNPAGESLVYSTYLGGSNITTLLNGPNAGTTGDQVEAIALDAAGGAYIAGVTQSSDFPITSDAFQTTIRSSFENAFLSRMEMTAVSSTVAPTVTVAAQKAVIPSAWPVTVNLSVEGKANGPDPTGTVIVAGGDYQTPPIPLHGGKARFVIPGRSLPSEPASPNNQALPLIARYLPDASAQADYNFAAGIGPVTVVGVAVGVAPSRSVISWQSAQTKPLAVTITATGGEGNPVPTGTVTLELAKFRSKPAPLKNGAATIDIPAGILGTGFTPLKGLYSGDANYTPGGGSSVAQVATATMTVVPAVTSIAVNQPLSVAITLNVSAGDPPLSGKVTVSCNQFELPLVPLENAKVTVTIPAGTLRVGPNSIYVESGDSNYAGASGLAQVTGLPASSDARQGPQR